MFSIEPFLSCLTFHTVVLPGSPLHLALKLKVMKDELADECDYSREASFLKRYGAPECLGEDARFKVPWVWPGSAERVLVMEHVEGSALGMLLLKRCLRRNGTRCARYLFRGGLEHTQC